MLLTAICQAHPTLSAQGYLKRGHARQVRGDQAGALADYNQAIALDPRLTMAYFNRGSLRRQRGDLAGALGDYNQVLAFNPREGRAYYNRGIALLNAGAALGSFADFDQAIACDPKLAMAYNNRGFVKLELGDQQGARADFEQALALDPQLEIAQHNSRRIEKDDAASTPPTATPDWSAIFESAKRGVELLRQGQEEAAQRAFAQCLQLRPELKAQIDWAIGLNKKLRTQPKSTQPNGARRAP